MTEIQAENVKGWWGKVLMFTAARIFWSKARAAIQNNTNTGRKVHTAALLQRAKRNNTEM